MHNFFLFCRNHSICGYSDTLATVTLLPGPEGVNLGSSSVDAGSTVVADFSNNELTKSFCDPYSYFL